MKMHKQVAKFGIVMGALIAVAGVSGTQQAQAADSMDNEIGLTMTSAASITAVTDANIEPSLTEIMAGTVTKNSAFSLTVDSSAGSEVTISGDETGELMNAHLSLQVGAGAFVLASDSTTPLYSTTEREDGAVIPVNVKITNLDNYAVSATPYTNTVTFTITAAD